MKTKGQLRIIGGQWRRRTLHFPAIDTLRPSPDAVRETLFNWLMPYIRGCVCLDLFSGSGAFGFEAVSRGAAKAILVEKSPQAVKYLNQSSQALNAGTLIEVRHQNAEKYLNSSKTKFDLVFLDPPFQEQILENICNKLIEYNRLNPDALIYIETPKSNTPLPIPSSWHIIRQARRGQVQSTLINSRESGK